MLLKVITPQHPPTAEWKCLRAIVRIRVDILRGGLQCQSVEHAGPCQILPISIIGFPGNRDLVGLWRTAIHCDF